jgi:hypothetical protein
LCVDADGFVPGQSALAFKFQDSGEFETPDVDLGPLLGRKTGFKTKDRIPFSGGISGWICVMNVKEGLGRWRRIGMG